MTDGPQKLLNLLRERKKLSGRDVLANHYQIKAASTSDVLEALVDSGEATGSEIISLMHWDCGIMTLESYVNELRLPLWKKLWRRREELPLEVVVHMHWLRRVHDYPLEDTRTND
jgi:hypothetical protein